jgi:hypothetical protein
MHKSTDIVSETLEIIVSVLLLQQPAIKVVLENLGKLHAASDIEPVAGQRAVRVWE